MARRSGTSNSVSLFPFLAVLICTMGALIFLLLVTTRRVRAVAVERAQEQAGSVLTDAPALDLGFAVSQPELRPTTPEVTALAVADDASLNDLLAEWQNRVATLEEQRALRRHTAEQHKLRLNAAERELRAAQQSLAALEARLAELSLERRQSSALASDLESQRKSLEEQIAAAQRRCQQAEAEQRSAKSRFMILPFDPRLGTTRRPIFIECTATGLRFLPEDIALTSMDFEGFSARVNPLRAGTEGLIRYWMERNNQQPAAEREPEPYVLLLVRPSGTITYYVAQRMLSALSQRYGYELIEETTEFALPPAELGAVAACRTAIEKLLAERQQIVDQVTTARSLRSGSGTTETGDGFLGLMEGGGSPAPRTWERPKQLEGQPYRRGVTGSALAPSQGDSSSGSINRDQTTALDKSTSIFGSARELGLDHSKAGSSEGQSRGTEAQSTTSGSTVARTIDGGLTQKTGKGSPQSPAGSSSKPGSAFPEEQEPPFPRLGQAARRGFPERSFDDLMKSRRWGLAGPSATIGLERTMTIHVRSDRLIVADELVVRTGQGETQQQLLESVTAAIDQQARTWGRAPEGFYWMPSVKFIVSPGGNLNYERLHGPLARWGITSRVDYVLE